MGEIINLKFKKGFSFETNAGYNLLTKEIVLAGYEYLRMDGLCDFYIAKTDYTSDHTTIQKGYVDSGISKNTEEYADITIGQQSLVNLAEGTKAIALSEVKTVSDYYHYSHWNDSLVWVKSSQGIILAGWHSDVEARKKGELMCQYLLYALGFINPDKDDTLWTSTYKYLLFQTGSADYYDFDRIILDALKERILIENNK